MAFDQYGNKIDDIYGEMESLGKMMEGKVKGFESMLNNIHKNIKEEDRAEFGKVFGAQINEMDSLVGRAKEAAENAAKRYERNN